MSKNVRRKLSFWTLLFTRFKYDSFYEMYNSLALEPDERKGIVRTILRMFIKTTLIFCVIGIAVWIWYYIIDPNNTSALKIIMIGTPIAIGVLSILGFFSRKMLKDFSAFTKRQSDLTKGSGNSEGIMYDIFDLD